MLDRLSQRERIMLILFIFISIIALYYFFVYQPLQNKVNNLTNQVEMKGKEFTNILNLIEKLPDLKERYNELIEIEDIMSERESCTAEYILNTIEEKTAQNNIEIISFIPVEEENKIKMNINLSGNYKNYTLFLDSLAGLEYQVEFNRLQLQSYNDQLILNIILICNTNLKAGENT